MLLHVVLLCVCMMQQQQQRLTHPPNKKPLAHTHHSLGRTYSSNRFFVSFCAIPLLASEASLLTIPIYHHRFARELSFFRPSLFCFSGNDWLMIGRV